MKKTLVAAAMILASMSQVQASDWGYHGEHAPEHWGKVSAICAQGQNQSPIDISDVTKAELKNLKFDYSGQAVSVTNNGHTLQASVSEQNTLWVDDKAFELKQFHFHTPSENHVDGQSYPLEAHYVHADKDGHLAVVSLFFKLGEQNAELAKLLAVAPKEEAKADLSKPFDVTSLLPKEKQYYRFNGSLTTPPCSEGVRWLVLKQPLTISADQVETFEQLMGHNNRPIQAINARVVMGQ